MLPRTLVFAPVSDWRLPKLSSERATEGGFRLISDVGGDVRNAPRCFLERTWIGCGPERWRSLVLPCCFD